MNFKWRKWNRAVHRDLGYIFFAMTVIYSLSGIAINHIKDWNPNYAISVQDVHVDAPHEIAQIDKNEVLKILSQFGEEDHYKKHYFPTSYQLKIFLTGGNATIDLDTGTATVERVTRRPILHAVNYLHYNPGKWWTLFSDIFAAALIVLAFTGLFVLKGKNGITKRGAILTIIGIIIPLAFLFLFY